MTDIRAHPAVEPLTPPRPPLPSTSHDRTSRRRHWLLPAVCAVAGVALGAVLGSTITGTVTAAQYEAAERAAAAEAEAQKETRFADSAKKCNASSVVEIADTGRTMIIDGKGEDFGSGDVTFSQLDCILSALEVPTSVDARMYQTRSLDGRQEAEWDGIRASWTYHPDDGLDLILERAD